MTEELGLRARKKRQTAARIWQVAVDLCAERGFDHVSVAEIAEAADVSKMTVFNYFGTKEDVIVGPMEDHAEDPARAVRERRPGESAVAAARRQFLEQIPRRDPSIGLGGDPRTLKVRQLIKETPTLAHRVVIFHMRSVQLLADELAEETGDMLLARVAAAQLIGARNALIMQNHERTLAGDPDDEIAKGCAEAAERAFDLVEKGLQGYPGNA
ncbi:MULTISPECIES: TetR/AcrR family transcriptional regulator [Streptomyces]|uniref:TetR family transcriptional regulator n=1 Tax=Streptomyces venezuelae TaxID=54571 RepID=A0A5P2BN72_STRVZ|nr:MULTISPECIES: TetR/AcrR family transcriptional regulator [Streptomyces]NEA00006.1 TetR family transcriptional regulator [Streptomyces sp. SID10116]MYY85653.1 TetR family transcriptional regulator [Streptomyces sp. SID335]MYZ15946.1 TetR family transcriptional regulator [Streptomyces sp. SID337]NDZ86052.1 TetR family transcriptional regulator [Streptomyces sp. SID10115]NEB45344.1 TetR family transcriptional regulator [Streptomyces sp. SID339]